MAPVYEMLRDGPRGFDPETGQIQIGKLDEITSDAYLIWSFISATDDVFVNLHFVLSDLAELRRFPRHFPGNVRTRYYLLLRTFFYEFYRFREIFRSFTKALERRDYYDADTTRSLRSGFQRDFDGTIGLRNVLVHSDGNPWVGEDHTTLAMVDQAATLGYALVHRETGERTRVETIVARLCDRSVPALHRERDRMRTILQAVVDALAGTLPQPDPQESGAQPAGAG